MPASYNNANSNHHIHDTININVNMTSNSNHKHTMHHNNTDMHNDRNNKIV